MRQMPLSASHLNGVTFFSIVRCNPSAQPTARFAPRIESSSAVAIVVRDVLRKDTLSKTCTVALEAADGSAASSNVMLLSSLGTFDLLSMCRWKNSDLICRLVAPAPADLVDSVQSVCQTMLQKGASHGGGVYVSSRTDMDEQHALQHLLSMSCVKCEWENPEQSGWQLTLEGISRLQLIRDIHSPDYLVNVPPVDDALKDPTGLSTFEALCILSHRGWECSIMHGKSKTVQPFTSAPEAAKIWWHRSGRRTLERLYLISLLLADTGKAREVQHLQPTLYYQCLVEGKEYIARRRRTKKNDFSFGGFTSALTADTTPILRSKRAAKARAAAPPGYRFPFLI
jgi:hypothetical protein